MPKKKVPRTPSQENEIRAPTTIIVLYCVSNSMCFLRCAMFNTRYVYSLLLQITYAKVFSLKENFILFTLIKNVIFSTTTKVSVIYSKRRLKR